MGGEVKLKYSPDVDALVITIGDEKPAYGDEVAPGIILHYGEGGKLVEIEMLDASDFLSAAVKEMAKTVKAAIQPAQK